MNKLNLHLCMQLKRNQNPKTSLSDIGQDWKCLSYMACVFNRYNAHSGWLALGYYSPVMPTGRWRACIDRAKSQRIKNSLTSNVQSLRENRMIKPRLCRIVAIARSVRHCLGLDFLVETPPSVNKQLLINRSVLWRGLGLSHAWKIICRNLYNLTILKLGCGA